MTPAAWVCAILAAWGAVSAAQDREAAVRDVFREMLHISPPRSPGGGRLPSAPRHMVELYHQFVNRQGDFAPLEGGTTTVRNFLPIKGGKELLLFNVSSVGGEEEVSLAQLQLNRRRLHQRHRHRRLLAPPYRVRLFRASPGGKLAPLGSIPVSMVQRSVWTSVDITAPLRELLLDPRGEVTGHSLAVRFEAPSGKTVPPSHFLRGFPEDSYAFLVVFSKDGEEEVTEDGGRPPPKPPVHSHALVQRLQMGGLKDVFKDEVDNNPEMIPDFGKTRRVFTRNVTLSTNSLFSTPPTDRETPEDRSAENEIGRKTRSIIDNKLSNENEDLQISVSSPESFLTTRMEFYNPESHSKKPKKVRKGKRKGGKKQKYPYSPEGKYNPYQAAEEGAGCSVRKMTVNFAEIGWGEWIISPSMFDANYCTGSCRFPLTEALKPSNHATLQSLVHALGADPRVPAPSCVPHRLSPITLLYFDHTLNVVLKNYPSMVVESCACR